MTPQEQARFQEGISAGLAAALSVASDGYTSGANAQNILGVLHKLLITPNTSEVIAKYLTPENLANSEVSPLPQMLRELMLLLDPNLREAVRKLQKRTQS